MFKKNIEINFSTFDPFLLENLPPVDGNDSMPSWFKNTASRGGNWDITEGIKGLCPLKGPTMKRCPVLNEYFQTGITIPLWTDIDFYVDCKERSIEWRYANTYSDLELISSHSPEQYPELKNDYIQIKFINPWIAQCNTDVSWLVTRPVYSNLEFDKHGIIFCDGVVNFKRNFNTHVNLFFPIKKENYTVKFEAGTPFQKLIPLCDKKINMNSSYCTKEYYYYAGLFGRRISWSPGKFYNSLSKKFKEMIQ